MRNLGWNFHNTYTQLPEIFYSFEKPDLVPKPKLVLINNDLSRDLGFQFNPSQDMAKIVSGQVLDDSSTPYSQSYAGHQYAFFTNLGDGRAVILGEHVTPSQERYDVQLKGSGRTRYSRGGDGKATLGPMIREYIISEAMHKLGIPTSRSLAVATTGELVTREKALPGAVLTRIAKSHIRVGTFEFASALKEKSHLIALADYTISRHFPEVQDIQNKYISFCKEVVERQAKLIVAWQGVGFVHGVMNTDNMLVSGETIDYGPCAFMDSYNPNTVFSSIDRQGRYAFGNQPYIAKWNLARFIECLLPLFHDEEEEALRIAEDIINEFDNIFSNEYRKHMLKKIGIKNAQVGDEDMFNSLLDIMKIHSLDYTNTFRNLSKGAQGEVFEKADLKVWHGKWLGRIKEEARPVEQIWLEMNTVNPAVIPRNHIVEEALKECVENENLKPTEQLIEIIRNPYTSDEIDPKFIEPSLCNDPDTPYRTFCGT